MATYTIVTTHSALISAGASFEAAGLRAAVSARFDGRSATLRGLGLRGMILPHGLRAPRLAHKGELPVYAPIPRVGVLFPNTTPTSNVTSTPCQSRGRKSFT